MPERVLGWRKDKFDRRDKLHSTRVKVVLPPIVDLSEFTPEVRDQGSEGSCTGHGEGGQITSQGIKQGQPKDWFSPRWIYNGARFLEGTIGQDSGAYSRDGYDWMFKKGCLLNSIWPYVAGVDTFRTPPSSYEPEAAKFPIVEYIRADDGVDGICSAFAQGYFVSLGSPWFSQWMDVGADGKIPEITGGFPSGGHETFLFGYDYPARVFFLQNSWGLEWGKQGIGYLPFSAIDKFKELGGYDAYYTVFDWSETPVPPIPPTPEPNSAAKLVGRVASVTLKVVCPKSEIVVRAKK
jgi:hypothetical protein